MSGPQALVQGLAARVGEPIPVGAEPADPELREAPVNERVGGAEVVAGEILQRDADTIGAGRGAKPGEHAAHGGAEAHTQACLDRDERVKARATEKRSEAP